MTERAESRPAWPGLWDRDESGAYLIGGRCRSCGKLALGIREFCPHCHSASSLDAEPVGRSGEIYAETTIHQGPPTFRTPYRVGYVDIEDGVRVFAHIGQGDNSPRIGDRATLEIQEVGIDREGKPLSVPVYVSTLVKAR
jgi:uncharacterized OB-fold protein